MTKFSKDLWVTDGLLLFFSLLLLFCMTMLPSDSVAGSKETVKHMNYSEQQELVDRAYITFSSFITDPAMSWFRQHLASAKGLFILPRSLRGGFIIGAEGGTGVMLAKDDRTGKWSYPVFYTMTSISFGIQAGAATSEIILMIMTDSGIDAVLSTSFKIGADATIAAGPEGAGAMAAMADIFAFSRSRGAYGGVSITGAMIYSDDEWNSAYYGHYVRPVDILISGKFKNSGAERLMQAIQKESETSASLLNGSDNMTDTQKTGI